MKTRTLALVLMLALVAAIAGCATEDEVEETPPLDDGAAGLRLANGLYDQEDGTVLAIGTLEWVDLEGGFYAITGSPEGDGNIAVIANADKFAAELEALEGKTVSAIGTRSDGVSIRMAGPEIVVETIEEISDTPGIAE